MDNQLFAIVDYGMGNLRSVGKALEISGAKVVVTDDPKIIRSAQAVILPGVGAFGPALEYLKKKKLDKVVIDAINENKYFLGLCLGFQLLFSVSEEDGRNQGLNIVPGIVSKFNFKKSKNNEIKCLKIPHMGWNRVTISNDAGRKKMFKGIDDGSYFYFVHSYFGIPESESVIAGSTNYGTEFCSAIVKDRIWACQFHPEKSGTAGLQLLKNFVKEVGSKQKVEVIKCL